MPPQELRSWMRVHCGLLVTRHTLPHLHRGPRDRQVQCGVHLCTKEKTLKNYFSLLVFQII